MASDIASERTQSAEPSAQPTRIAAPAGTQWLAAGDPVRERIRKAAQTVRDTTPLAQSVTNFVTVNLVANAQLAAGGTAAMSYLPDDVLATAQLCRASYINVGTLQPYYREAFPQIAEGFRKLGHPWVLDPVAAGIGETRTAILMAFRDNPPAVVRGNASEVITLARMWGLDAADTASDATDLAQNRPQGVESVDGVDAARGAAIALARFIGGAVAVSGETDLVTDGAAVYRLAGGSEYMTKITGAGCSLGGVVGTYLAVSDPLTAALAASALYNVAGAAAGAVAKGPGSFQVEFLDALWNTTPQQIADAPIAVEG
ncbi:MAG: hydroxyethylthiazole kinase [Bifidobacteriaceae bacterium]|nr:hydroxyethylthiazole kinase [Bifidobacteriaceae bacterium]